MCQYQGGASCPTSQSQFVCSTLEIFCNKLYSWLVCHRYRKFLDVFIGFSQLASVSPLEFNLTKQIIDVFFASTRNSCPMNVVQVALDCNKFVMMILHGSNFTCGGNRDIATGTVFRRLVSKTLARQFGPVVEASCVPFQVALSTRAGVDCVGHTIRAATDDNPRMTVLSVDGVGAYDHVLRATMLSKLRGTHHLHHICGNEEGQRHTIEQHEGGEQGDPLMPFFIWRAVCYFLRVWTMSTWCVCSTGCAPSSIC